MKNLISKLFLAALLAGIFASPAAAQGRIATVDLRKLFENYWKKKQAEAALKERAADFDKEDKEMKDELKKAAAEYQEMLKSANDQVVSSEERAKRKDAAEEKLKNVKETEDRVIQFERQARVTLDEQYKRMRENILREIKLVVESKAKQAAYSLVLDTAADSVNSTPIAVYSSGENDITEDVLKQLNAAAPETTEPKKEPVKKDEKK